MSLDAKEWSERLGIPLAPRDSWVYRQGTVIMIEGSPSDSSEENPPRPSLEVPLPHTLGGP
jgi:hypothetical protein